MGTGYYHLGMYKGLNVYNYTSEVEEPGFGADHVRRLNMGGYAFQSRVVFGHPGWLGNAPLLNSHG